MHVPFYSREKQPNYELTVEVPESEYVALVNLSAKFEGANIDLGQLIYAFEKGFPKEEPVETHSDYEEGIAWERKRWEIMWQIEVGCSCERNIDHFADRMARSENGIDYDKEWKDVG